MATDDPMIAALLREREGYVRRGLAGRAKLVDEQLALRGYRDPVKPEPDKAPRGRQAPPKRTAS